MFGGGAESRYRGSISVPLPDAATLTTFVTGRIGKRDVNVFIMTRRLVLTNEAARHPLRRSLPPPVIASAKNDDHDVKLFLLSFAAFFTCFYSFIF